MDNDICFRCMACLLENKYLWVLDLVIWEYVLIMSIRCGV
jgi:hypothetical protein